MNPHFKGSKVSQERTERKANGKTSHFNTEDEDNTFR
jgi:hypothetical protein